MGNKIMRLIVLSAVALSSACLADGAIADAQPPIRIGVLTDLSGAYSDYSGKGSVAAARMAVEDFGGQLFGRPIEIVMADHLNKADLGAAIARKWYENEGVDVIVDVPLSSVALAVQEVSRQLKKVVLYSAAGVSTLNGKACSPYGIQWSFDSYALTKGVATAFVKTGARKWYFLTSDYATGHAMQNDLTAFVIAAGGTVVGSVRHPVGASDFGSFLLQAQGSGADVIALANGGEDTTNSLKQGFEFGITQAGQRFAVLFMALTQMHSIGVDKLQGTVVSTSFVWNRDPSTREWSQRFFQKVQAMPSDTQAGVYSSVLHYLKAVQAAESRSADVVVAKMRALPVEDVYAHGGKVQENGAMIHDMYLVEVKPAAEIKEPWDYVKIIRTIPADEAFRPLAESECPLVTKAAAR